MVPWDVAIIQSLMTRESNNLTIYQKNVNKASDSRLIKRLMESVWVFGIKSKSASNAKLNGLRAETK